MAAAIVSLNSEIKIFDDLFEVHFWSINLTSNILVDALLFCICKQGYR
jgi:hypothetical protein